MPCLQVARRLGRSRWEASLEDNPLRLVSSALLKAYARLLINKVIQEQVSGKAHRKHSRARLRGTLPT